MDNSFKFICINSITFTIYWKGNTYTSSIKATSSCEQVKVSLLKTHIINKSPSLFTDEDISFLTFLTDFKTWIESISYGLITVKNGNIYINNIPIKYKDINLFIMYCARSCYDDNLNIFQFLESQDYNCNLSIINIFH